MFATHGSFSSCAGSSRIPNARIIDEIGRYGDERFVPILLARIETFDWRRDTPNDCQAAPLHDLLCALHDCGGTLPKRLRARVLDQFVDDQVGRALSRASDGTPRWECATDLVDNDEETRGAFARRFTWWAQPILSHVRDPREYFGVLWELGCIWARAFTSRADATDRDDASELLRSHRRLFADYHAMRSKRVRRSKSADVGT